MNQPLSTSDRGPDLTAPPLPRRMACWIYEGMLMFGVVFIAGYLFSTLTQTRHALDNRHMQQAFLFVIFGIYFVWFWAKGQTLAMKTWHIRVVDREGHAISQPRALLRYLLSWLWFLPPLAAGDWFRLSGGELTVITWAGWLSGPFWPAFIPSASFCTMPWPARAWSTTSHRSHRRNPDELAHFLPLHLLRIPPWH